MTPGARVAAAIDVLARVLDGAAAERELTRWARASRFAGSKDRAAVRDIVFACLRNLRSYQARAGGQGARAAVIGWCIANADDLGDIFSGHGYSANVLTEGELAGISQSPPMPKAEQYDLQDWVWHALVADLGEDKAGTCAIALQDRAPLDLRVNLAKGTRDAAQESLLAAGLETQKVVGVETALRSDAHSGRIVQMAPYTFGFVEIQDAASQALVAVIPLQDGTRVLDFCAGGGGKTLAMAAAYPSCRFAAWDVAPQRLAQLPPRATRAGATVTCLSARPGEADYDLVLVDAPCSGSGAWRRSPEAKWRLTESGLDELIATQRSILSAAWQCVAPGGTLVFATCSVLRAENEANVAWFQAQNGVPSTSEARWPVGAPGDGFFLATFVRPLSR
ncbi:MAG: RsmB/NOP family class I SAM-dependent RNA methyltransferase [Pseudomonadota bacterium]